MTKYSDGYRFECATRDAFKRDGYEVIRSAGSKGKVDLVAFKTDQILFVQCKLDSMCPLSERKELVRLAGLVGALPIVAFKHKEGRVAAEVRYRLLTGTGPYEYVKWLPDSVIGNDH